MKTIFLLIFTILAVAPAGATDYGIFVDGGYGKGQTRLNNLVTDRVTRAKAAFDKRPGSNSQYATTKDGLCTALDNITCGDGDTITIFMMGHGTRDKFVFSLQNSDKRISADELKNKITARITNCTCKVRLVIFSCHSGSFIDNLFKDEHVEAVYTSCRTDQKSYSDAVFKKDGFEDRGDWADKFVKKWENLSATADLGASLEAANSCALKDTPEEFAKQQTPTGWRRGTISCLAHVEETRFDSGSRSVLVTIYNPSHLRGQQIRVKPEGVGKPPPGTTYTRCQWLTFDATFGDPPTRNTRSRDLTPPNRPVIVSAPTPATAPQEEYLGHVKARSGNTVMVQMLKPYWLGCKERIMTAPTVSDNVTRCQFVTGTMSVTDPQRGLTATAGMSRSEYCPDVIIKVTDKDTDRSIFYGYIIRPLSLTWLTAKNPICVRLRNDQNKVLPDVAKNQLIRVLLKGGILGREVIRGRNARRIASSEAELVTFDPGIDGVADPAGEVPDTEPFVPEVRLGNFGTSAFGGAASLDFQIVDSVSAPVYSDSVVIPDMDPERSTVVEATPWFPPATGNYTLTTTINLGTSPDGNLSNNTVSYPFTVVTGSPVGHWDGQFIGVPLPMGFAVEERLMIAPGVGSGIATSADQLGFVHQEITGDFFVAAVGDFPALAPNAGLGFMARTDLIPQSAMVSWIREGSGATRFDSRANDGGNAVNHFNGLLPGAGDWIGFERSGDNFSVYASTDGGSWNEIAQQTVVLPPTLLVGVASYSGQNQSQPPSQVPLGGMHGFPVGLSDIPLLHEIVATALATDSILVEWPDVVTTEIGYNVYRSTDGISFDFAGSTGPNGTSIVDSGLSPATTYLYEVRPVTFEGETLIPCLGIAETHGNGLAAWAAANGIGDPFAAPAHEAEPPVFNYMTGSPAATVLYNAQILQMGVNTDYPWPVMTLTKGAGIHDYQFDIQYLDEFTGLWTTQVTLAGSEPAGTYVFDTYPTQRGAGLQRVVARPVTP